MEFSEIELLPEDLDFLMEIPVKAKEKIFFKMEMAKSKKVPKLFKLIQDGIWYFRTQNFGSHYRIFAFWDKSKVEQTLVLTTHGIIMEGGIIIMAGTMAIAAGIIILL